MVTPSYLAYERDRGPARPPNAWIIYRKTKLATLPPVPPGEPRRAQAEVSKIVSKMWREESDAVKADFERRAEAEKAKHRRQYPEYKFNPESKAAKERRKAAKAALKELERANSKRGRTRAAPYTIPAVVAPPSAHASGVPYDPAALYGSAGPSPPISGSSSPTSSKSGPQPLPLPEPRSQSYPARSFAHPSPSTESYQNQQNCEGLPSLALGMYAASMPPAQTHHSDSVHPALPHPHQYQPQNQLQTQQLESFTGDITSWSQPPSSDGQVTTQNEELTSYEMMSWSGEQNPGVHHATAFPTTDPSIFTLEGLDLNILLQDSPPEIELSLDMQLPSELQSAPYSQLASLFGYADLNGVPSSQTTDNTNAGPSRAISPAQITAPLAFFSNGHETPFSRSSSSSSVPQQNLVSPETSQSFFNNGVGTSSSSFAIPQQQYHSSYGQDAMQQYFNFDAHSSLSPLDHNTTPPRSAPPSHSHIMPTVAYTQRTSPPQHGTYVPPSAAVHTGTRRVAGSWKPPRSEPDSPVEHSSTESWPYPVSARS